MGVLNKDEIIRRLTKGELIIYPRKDEKGHYDVQPDSYDLVAGVAVWKEGYLDDKPDIKTIIRNKGLRDCEQPTTTVQPGQMVFVITNEEINLPPDVSGTVYSKNSIALEGILALNAGHVDPGYKGPIVIRLINLKASPWVLRMGEPIFTISFQTVDHMEGDVLESHKAYSLDFMVDRVRKTAQESLSNALFDLYAKKIDNRLDEHYASVQQRLRAGLAETFVSKEEIVSCLFKRVRAWIIGFIVFAATVLAAYYAFLQYGKTN